MASETENPQLPSKVSELSKPSNFGSHLELACYHVSESWFPVNPATEKKIQSALKNGSYDNDLELLLADIRTDLSLYTYCLRELSIQTKKVAAQRGDLVAPSNALELFKEHGFEALKALIINSEGKFSRHLFENVSDAQAQQIKNSLLSATTVALLSEKAEIESEAGYSCALVRQLGLTLIAWNYPHVYTRAVAGTNTLKNIDITLHKTLGFSPGLLGMTLARQWGLPMAIRFALGDSSVLSEQINKEQLELAKKEGEILTKLCHIGEALARANDPEHYPNSVGEWKIAEEGIREYLGANGVQIIAEQARQNCAAYSSQQPEFFALNVQQEEQQVKSSSYCRDKLEKNVFVKHCPAKLKKQFELLYYEMVPDQISRELITKLVKDIIPSAGFERGCIYSVDPFSMTLVAMLKIGPGSLTRYPAVKLNSSRVAADPIGAAFQCLTPTKQEELDEFGRRICTISASIGGSQKTGVLYLKLSDKLELNSEIDPILIFKAIRQCLNDCLGLAS